MRTIAVYAKFKNEKYIFLILYVDDILLASSDVNLLLETKKVFILEFWYEGSRWSFVHLGIEIHRDRRNEVLGLSQKAYLEKVLKKYNMQNYKPSPAPIVKGDRFVEFQCPRNQYEIDQIKTVPYASAVGSL